MSFDVSVFWSESMTAVPKLLVLIVEKRALLDFIQIICLIYIIRVEQLMFRDQCMKSMKGPHLLSTVRRGKEESNKAGGVRVDWTRNMRKLLVCSSGAVHTVYTVQQR